MKTLAFTALALALSFSAHASDRYMIDRTTVGGAGSQASSGSVAATNGNGFAISGNTSIASTSIAGRVMGNGIRMGSTTITNSVSTSLSLGNASGEAAGNASGGSYFDRVRSNIRWNGTPPQ